MKCTFYEATGNMNCPFHIIRYKLYFNGVNGIQESHWAIKRPKPAKRKTKTSRRVYGKSR